MRAHIVENGVVTNTIVVESLDILPGLIDASIGGTIGDLYDGAAFSKPVKPEPVVEPVPQPTKEELIAQLAALTKQIEALP